MHIPLMPESGMQIFHSISPVMLEYLAFLSTQQKTRQYTCLPPAIHHTKINSLRPRQNGRHFADDTFKRFFQNENVWISIKISLEFVPKAPINNIPSLVQIMAWCRPGDKPLSEPMMVSLLTHICITRPQWVNQLAPGRFDSNSKNILYQLNV